MLECARVGAERIDGLNKVFCSMRPNVLSQRKGVTHLALVKRATLPRPQTYVGDASDLLPFPP